MFESMSEAGLTWRRRIIRDERDSKLHNERATAQAQRAQAEKE